MTIHQLKAPCWELFPPLPGDDRESHYDTRAEARKDLAEAAENEHGVDPKSRPRQLAAACWVVQCDGDCEQVIDEEEEGWTVHHESRADAEETVAAWRWACSADGRSVFCPEDAPGDSEIPPPSPAELEAAGQMRLPGVA